MSICLPGSSRCPMYAVDLCRSVLFAQCQAVAPVSDCRDGRWPLVGAVCLCLTHALMAQQWESLCFELDCTDRLSCQAMSAGGEAWYVPLQRHQLNRYWVTMYLGCMQCQAVGVPCICVGTRVNFDVFNLHGLIGMTCRSINRLTSICCIMCTVLTVWLHGASAWRS